MFAGFLLSLAMIVYGIIGLSDPGAIEVLGEESRSKRGLKVDDYIVFEKRVKITAGFALVLGLGLLSLILYSAIAG